MLGVSVFSGLTVLFLSIPVLYKLFENSIAIERRLNSLSAKKQKHEYDELELPFTERFIKPALKSCAKAITKMLPKSRETKGMDKLARQLKLGGIKMSPQEFTALRVVISVVSFCTALSIGRLYFIPLQTRMLIYVIASIVSVLIPRYYLSYKVKNRQLAIRNQMADVIDLLCVSVEAGLGFDAALVRLSEKANGPLVDELNIMLHEIQMGKARKDALKDLGERNDIQELKIFTSAMIQVEQLGISIKNVLKVQSEQLRLARRQRASEKAMKAPVKMMLPLVIFVFPVIFIILLGPSVMDIMKALG